MSHKRLILLAGTVILFLLVAVFVCQSIKKAAGKEFWIDEIHGLEMSAGHATWGSLLIRGASGQGSVAPLDYMILKGWDNARRAGWGRDIPHNVYYRLHPIGVSALAAFIVAFGFLLYFYRSSSNSMVFAVQGLMAAAACGLFLFKWPTAYFAVETRPYALWNALWFVMLAFFALRGPSLRWVLPVGILVSMTSLGALTQVLLLAVSHVLLRSLERKPVQETLWLALKLYALPLGIASYYSLQVNQFGFIPNPSEYERYMNEFTAFWQGKWHVLVAASLGLVMTLRRPDCRNLSVIFLFFALAWILAPLFNYQVLSRGFFFTSRQYIYLDLVHPFLLLTFGCLLPALVGRMRLS